VATAANPIDVVEAAYEFERNDADWLRNLAGILRPLVDGGRGLAAYTFDFTSATPVPEHPLLIGMEPIDWASVLRMGRVSARFAEMTRVMHVHPEPFGALLDEARRAGLGDLRDDPEGAEFFRTGIGDVVSLRTIEPGGKGVIFAGIHSEQHRVDRRSVRLWSRVAAHVAAARRLRSVAALPDDDAEAVLNPSGRIDDARGEGATPSAREALRAAVLRQERARGRERRTDPARATEAWTALVSGRWSLVDRFERGGRRFIVAHRNTHALPDPRSLTERERTVAHLAALGKSNKLIAYEVGLGESTVATHLATAMRKLGVKSRIDLVQLLRGLSLA